jgi:energy-coupling factor transporter transmembrane protein EcfT
MHDVDWVGVVLGVFWLGVALVRRSDWWVRIASGALGFVGVLGSLSHWRWLIVPLIAVEGLFVLILIVDGVGAVSYERRMSPHVQRRARARRLARKKKAYERRKVAQARSKFDPRRCR